MSEGTENNNAPVRKYGPEPEKDFVVNEGFMVKQGTLMVPHATELDVKIERLTPTKPKEGENLEEPNKYTFVLLARNAKAEEATAHLLAPTSSTKVAIPGSTLRYQLWALETSRLQDLMRPPESSPKEAISGAETAAGLSEAADAKDSVPAITPPTALPTESSAVVSTPTPPAVPELALEPMTWSCSICTLINSVDDDECAVCGSRRDTASAATESEAATAGWWCPTCTLINPLSVHR